MAEIFGAVASGAGLLSLSMQLLESSQKLKGFYNASRDALQTVADLSFELETMSLSLRQLVIHRQADVSSDTLLGRRMMTCTLMTTKIEAAVDKIEHHLRAGDLEAVGISADLNELPDMSTVDLSRNHYVYCLHLDGIGSNSLLTDEALREVIVSQTVPFNQCHPIDRFCAAVNARGWSAEAFVKLVDTASDVHLAQRKDRQGRTALHWAAEHFGCWMSRPAGFAMSRQYGELCMILIANGADRNALDSEKRTPFVCLLRALHTGMAYWLESDLCDAVAQWGQYIQDAGVSLHAYVLVENLAQSRHGSAAPNLSIKCCKGYPWTCRLIISESLTLAIEVGFSIPHRVWQYNPPPGTWRKENHGLDKIGWEPFGYFEGDDYVLWQQVEDSNLDLPPLPFCPYKASSFTENAAQAWEEWFTGVQDDHGFVCMTMQRPPQVPQERRRTRRAASLPPPTTMLEWLSQTPDEQYIICQSTEDRWVSNPHNCPLDLKWKSAYRSTNDGWASRRRCMLGRCDDGEPYLLGTRHWEVKLLDDESNIEIARRFADRFRPEWRHIVEENHRRRQRWAELGMPAM